MAYETYVSQIKMFDKIVPLDNEYKNPIRFTTKAQAYTFFNGYMTNFDITSNANWSLQPRYNITFGDGINQTITYLLPKKDYPSNLLNGNYAVTREFNSALSTQVIKFWFVNNIEILNYDDETENNLIKLELELDVLSTNIYGIDYEIEKNVMFERKHCNRFKTTNVSDRYVFDLDTIKSYDELDENVVADVTKQVKKFEYYDNVQIASSLKARLRKINWCYFIFSEKPSFDSGIEAIVSKQFGIANSTDSVSATIDGWLSKSMNLTGLYIYAVPMVERFKFASNDTHSYSFSDTYNFIMGTYSASLVNIIVLPFICDLYVSNATISELNDTYSTFIYEPYHYTQNNTEMFGNIGVIISYSGSGDYSFLRIHYLKENSSFESALIPLLTNFALSNYGDSVAKDITLEPKLQKAPYSYIMLKTMNGEYIYDKTLLNQNYVLPTTRIMLNATGCKIQHTLEPYQVGSVGGSDFYYEHQQVEQQGIIEDITTSLNLKNDEWANYIAQNKNWKLMTLLSPISGSLSANARKGENLKSSIGLTGSLAVVNGISNLIELSNIKARPESIKASANDFYFQFILGKGITPKIIYKELNSEVKQRVFDYYFEYGYKVNKDLPFASAFNRKNFNYIKIDDNIINRFKILTDNKNYINKKIIDKINEIFNNGCKLWNVTNDLFDNTKENWEVSIT